MGGRESGAAEKHDDMSAKVWREPTICGILCVMTGSQLKTWRKRLKLKAYEAAEALGVARDTYTRLEARREVDRRTALACAAIAHGLPPAEG